MLQHLLERATNWLALGAATNPIWMPSAATLHNGLSIIFMLLGIVWLGVQIWAKFRHDAREVRREDRRRDGE